MTKFFVPLLFCFFWVSVIFAGTDYFKENVYDVGGDKVSLKLISNTNSYIDQYDRLWSIVKVSPDTYKAIPSGNNKCLLENVSMHPYFEKDTDLAKYIAHDSRCSLKATPFEAYTFARSENELISFTFSVCPSGYEEKGYCEKVAHLSTDKLNNSLAVN
ncbi:hypothetical protein [Alteromonas oceanisediminis]|uniref:hypothetical protein n=1 Tax=Alteromonas oceanisediminis TaxID=2836180 RepID=UPI001BD95881|nr:hypothetical protein [Alteromonas oceanisediminis]MBT0587964.1 hypothetical protein [Alteromonas oceanisediminis]